MTDEIGKLIAEELLQIRATLAAMAREAQEDREARAARDKRQRAIELHDELVKALQTVLDSADVPRNLAAYARGLLARARP